tara:strand:+ start:8156 stop:9484 length:1329 start_codon:yes stop_codon:yes gene_type:complete
MGFQVEIVPRSERESLIAKRVENSTEFGETIYDFRSGELKPKVISINIAWPVYRMENCRTFSAQQSEIAVQGYDKDFFSKGQEKSSVQQVQHHILAKLAKHGTGSVTPIVDILKEVGQREPILITHTGVVVNGNRRLSAMRELYRNSDGSVDERFSHIECAVLPPDTTPDEIDDIEADLQARPQTKLDYDWIGDARLVRRQVNKGRTTKEVADRLRRSKSDIENVLQALDEADLYLTEWAKKPGQYELVSADGEQIFADIPKKISKKNAEIQNASRAIAWSLFENRSKLPGRVYSFNAAFGKLAPQILDVLIDELEIVSDAEDDDDEFDADFEIEIETEAGIKNYQAVIDALRNDDTGDAIVVLIDACESAIERDKGLKSEKAALKALSQANAKVAGVDVSMAGESTLPAMKKQIDAIRDTLKKIELKIEHRLADNDDAPGE